MMIFEVLRRAWNEVRKEKYEAKKAKTEVEVLLQQIKNTITVVNEAYDSLSRIYKNLPEKDRQDYVQKTLDLLKFTGVGNPKETAYVFYNKLYLDYSDYYEINLMYHYWDNKEWKKVVEVCEKIKDDINGSLGTFIKR